MKHQKHNKVPRTTRPQRADGEMKSACARLQASARQAGRSPRRAHVRTVASKSSSSNVGNVITIDDSDDGSVEGQFSEGEGEEEPPAASGPPFEAYDGYDFSEAILADSGSPNCALCGTELEVSWDAERKALVHHGAVRLKGRIYKVDCLQRRRGPEPQLGGERRQRTG